MACLLRRSLLGLAIVAVVALSSFVGWDALAIGGTLPALNAPAPTFALPDNTGNSVALEDYRGQWVVLYFYPQDFTSGCTIEARFFQRDLPQYIDRNAQVIGVSTDNVRSHDEFCDAEGLRFPLLADTQGKVSEAYGSVMRAAGWWSQPHSVRHSFIIDPDGLLREIFLGVRPASHSAEVLARLDALQQAS